MKRATASFVTGRLHHRLFPITRYLFNIQLRRIL